MRFAEARMPAEHVVRRILCAAMVTFVTGCGREGGPLVKVTIPVGSTMRGATDSLVRAGLVQWAEPFRLYASWRGTDRGIKAGTYMLRKNASWDSLLEALHAGKGILKVVTIPEGFSLSQIEPLLAERLDQPIDSVRAATRDTALLARLDIPSPTLEGYLFPDTYTFADGTTARAAVATMVRRFEQVWKVEWTARLDSLHLSRNDVMSLAAIVEKEARLAPERPVIAAVYLNRLRRGMLLQADPTVQYALGKHVTRVFYKDLTIDSPFNTYKYKGLPPGPIASPGEPSIEAALYPADVPYRFFVAYPDGHHEFRVDLRGHERAKAEARKAWDAMEAARRGDSARGK
jgi:UPF0755 protein